MSSKPLLEVRNLETFYGPIMAIRGVSLEVHKGSVVTVLGANGAGKTTLLKTISGIMDPEKGEILFETLFAATFCLGFKLGGAAFCLNCLSLELFYFYNQLIII